MASQRFERMPVSKAPLFSPGSGAAQARRWTSAIQSRCIRIAAAMTMALLLPENIRALESEVLELTSYMGIRFQNTTLQALMAQFGESELFDPPGEALLPDEVCYQAEDEIKATFFVEHYGRKGSPSTVTGVEISRHAMSDGVGPATKIAKCAVPKVKLSSCIGRLCLGDSIEQVKQIMRKEMTSPSINEWTYDVRLSPDDLVVSVYRDPTEAAVVPDWMYPSHVVRVQVPNGLVTAISVEIDIDME